MTSPAPCPEASPQRNRSLRLAVITSWVCKVGTVALRLISIPIAIHLLGMKLFGVYAAITMAVGMIDMGQIGLGPALIKEIAATVAKGDRARETSVFATGILISSGLTMIVATVALILAPGRSHSDAIRGRFCLRRRPDEKRRDPWPFHHPDRGALHAL